MWWPICATMQLCKDSKFGEFPGQHTMWRGRRGGEKRVFKGRRHMGKKQDNGRLEGGDWTGSYDKFKPLSGSSMEQPEAAPVCSDLGHLWRWPIGAAAGDKPPFPKVAVLFLVLDTAHAKPASLFCISLNCTAHHWAWNYFNQLHSKCHLVNDVSRLN